MIATDLLRAAVIASVPFLHALGALPLWWIFASGFVTTTLSILFNSAEFAAIPSLVATDDLVEANGRIQAAYSFATIAGPPLAGLVAAVTSVANVLYLDALSFVVSALTLAWIGRSFNAGERAARRGVRADIAEGLRYVWGHPVLRSISIMMALVNFVAAPVWVELVLFASERFGASSFQYGLLVSAGSVGMIVLSLAAGPLRRKFSFSQVALGALMASGLLTVAFALAPNYWVALPIFAVAMGFGPLFNINTSSLRQAIVPNELLGRIMSVAMVLAASATPLGALVGGLLVARLGAVPVYLLVGVLSFAIPVAFVFSPLGHADDYLPPPDQGEVADGPDEPDGRVITGSARARSSSCTAPPTRSSPTPARAPSTSGCGSPSA